MSVSAAPRRRDLALTLRRRWGWSNLVTAGILVVLAIVDVSLQPALANLEQIGLLLQTALPLVFVAVAQTLVVLVGGIDLSVGGVFVVANAITVVWVGGAGGAHQALLVVALAVGLAMGALNGLLVVGLRFEPFIATLGTWTIFNGIALTILPTDGGTPPPMLTTLINGTVAGIPNSIVILAIAFGIWRGLRATRFGVRLYAVGADEERARLNGTPVRRVKLAAYALAGFCAAIGGIYAAGATASGTPTAGDAYILTTVAAVVIGGTSLRGGEGGVGMTMMAALVLTLISDIVQAVNLAVWVSVAASAGLLLVLVAARSMIETRLARRRA
ncbi:MAG: ABC transporter permease [Solirubrobacteraceae bacterium]